MSNHKAARALINRLVEKYGDGGYIFRGTPKRHSMKSKDGYRDGINSTLYRWAMKGGENEKIPRQQSLYRDAFTNNPHFSIDLMEKEIVEKFSRRLKIKQTPLEILTDLQHFGGNTNMIDFSYSLYVALFFTCQSNFNESGELVALHKDKLTQIEKIDYSTPKKNGSLEVITPAIAQGSHQRVHFQSSVFVRPADGYINPKVCERFRICRKFKASLSEYLRIFHNLTEESVYSDLHGFIKNEKNNETAILYFHLGNAAHEKGDFQTAIKYYGECIQISPNKPVPYNNRGNAYSDLKQFAPALADYDKATLIKPDFHEAYYNKGLVCRQIRQNDRAIGCFGSAITHKDDFAEAYYERGNAYGCLGEFKLAIMDYDKAMSLKDDYVNAKIFRELAKKMASNGSTGADFAKAMQRSFAP